MTTEQRKKNCSTLNDLCSTVKGLDDRLVSEHIDRVNTELQLQLDFDSKVTQNTNQLRNEFSQEIEAVNSNIKTEVSKAIASVVDEAPERFDTLKEAADWIQTHGTEAAAMQSAITNLENNLTQEVLDRTTQLSNKVDKDLSNVIGTLSVSNGGTGNTTAKDACNTFLNALDTGASTPEDKDYYISQYANGGTTTTTYHRRPMSALWEYIKGKISSVLDLTDSQYNGATKLDNATGTLTIAKGGTGATRAKEGFMNLANGLIPSQDPLYAEYMIYKGISGNWGLYTLLTFWEYIKGKISTILGLTSSNYGGTSAKATSDSSGNNIVNTYATKSVATTTQNGLMSSSDKSKLDTLVPVGTIFSGVYSTAPSGYLLCNGSTFNKDTYPSLYNVLGTNVLPDLRGRFLQGANGNLKQSIEAGLPNITGSFNVDDEGLGVIRGAFTNAGTAPGPGGEGSGRKVNFSAANSSSIYGNSTTVQPPAYAVNFIIKY